MHELLEHKQKLNRFTTDSNGQFTYKENCMCTIADREWLNPAIAREFLSIRLLLIVHYLLVLFFSALKSQPSQACRPPSCSKCQLANLEDYQTPCLYVKKLVDSVWNNSCFYWLMWSGPIVINCYIGDTVGTGIPLPSHQPDNLWWEIGGKKGRIAFI